MTKENSPTQPINSKSIHKETPAVFKIPKMIGSYPIESLLNKSEMSYVYLAEHPETKEPVIIKVLSPKYLSHPQVVQHFLNEANIIAMADHPNIVKLYGNGNWEGGLYIAMEFIQGVSLKQYLQYHPLSLEHALEIILQIAYALCHLHTHGVIHRDLKLENVLVADDGTVKVIDFGIAQLLAESDSTSRQQFMGTPIYMSPELRQNPSLVSYPSDIYSLGIISYELILGKLSHGRVHLSLIPKGLQKILAKSLQPHIEERYHDIVDFITDISSYMNSETLQKEKKEVDYLGEHAESLEQAQLILISPTPKWKHLEIGVSFHRALSFIGVSIDYLLLPDNRYGIIMIKPSVNSAEALIYLSILRGMVRTLSPLLSKPEKLISFLNEQIIKEDCHQFFSLSYLLFSTNEKQFHYISCGNEYLWYLPMDHSHPTKISCTNNALGESIHSEFREIIHSWNPQDRLICSSFGLSTEEEFQQKIKDTIIEYLSLPAQKQAEAILRKLKASSAKTLEEYAEAIITIQGRVPHDAKDDI